MEDSILKKNDNVSEELSEEFKHGISKSRLYTPARIRRRAKIQQQKGDNAIIHSGVVFDEVFVEKTKESDKFSDFEQLSKDYEIDTVQKDSMLQEFLEREKVREKAILKEKITKRNASYTSVEAYFTPKPNYSRILTENISISSAESLNINDNNASSHLIKEDKKLRILATLLPDEVLIDPVSNKPRPCNIAVMFPDVSGFTQLCLKYDKTGKGGPSRLTEVLNGYIGSMIQIVLSKNGDVFKFGGDAFLCVWKVTKDLSIMEVVHLAIETGVEIQRNCGEHRTDVGVKLGVKIAVAAGKALFSTIGTETRKHYVMVGPPVMDVKDAEQLCKTGDVIVAPSAWKYVENYMLYSYTYHTDNKHIKVHDFGPLWKSANRIDSLLKTSSSENIRPHLTDANSLQVDDLRPYILPPVMKSISMNQSLDYLTEMRQVAIVFLNVVAGFKAMVLKDITQICNKVFTIVTGIVDNSDGAVNKLTLFDKDMAILVVFGLKGFKHELASQVALKCAFTCVEQVKKLKVDSVSAGVTTGMAYCGVIGHPLRREYTVMGHPVNMAARLMCAYDDVVSLDRETFLHSKLESGHFELLEQKSLKGIQTPGPFYKFHLHPKRKNLKLDLHAYPLLGRAKEIQKFEKFLANSLDESNTVNFMIIYGDARIGKSRLVARLINIAENYKFISEAQRRRLRRNCMEICIIPLTEDDAKSSYSASRLMFQPALGFSENSTVEEREDKIISKLGEIRDNFLLASLNPVLNVNFDLMPQYLALTAHEQTDVRMTMVQCLYNKCFPKGRKWLIVIDDAEYMDEESWNLLKWCAHESYSVLYLLTIGQQKPLPHSAFDCLETVNSEKITLTEIEKWFYAGLACQLLGVQAIPVELVNLIQKYKSSGNPGWLESFLLSLIQSGRIYVAVASSEEIKNKRLVTAPDEKMMSSKSKDVEKNDSSYWLDCLETFEQAPESDPKDVYVCLLGPNFFSSDEQESELTMDTIFLKTIDTLKPLEQLVLKAGSALGTTFQRTALKYIVSRDTPIEDRQLCKVIRTLFDIKILLCARGDLTELNLLVPRRMILVTSIRKKVSCECAGVIIPEDCKDLPPYASCGYMQFRTSALRDTVYNLLLDDQKKKFHYYCIEFFRKNTYRCKACNSVLFTKVLGSESEDDNEITLVCTSTAMHGVRSTILQKKSAFPITSNYSLKLFKLFSVRRSSDESHNFETDFGYKFNKEIGDCQCPEILSSVYSVLQEHALGAGRKDIMLEIQLEYASVCLTSYNIPLAMQVLEDALTLVNQMKEEKEYPDYCTPFIYGKIYTLMGATKLSMGRPDNSLEHLETSLRYMKVDLSKNKTKVKCSIITQINRLWLQTKYFPEKYVGNVSDKKAPFYDLLSECLGLISTVHIYMQNWLMAKYVSVMALNYALKSNMNFYGLCMAYTTMMDVAYHNNDYQTCAKMEFCAIDMCKRCTSIINEAYELEGICKLYRVIFQTRHVRAKIEEAVYIGFKSIKIASIIRSMSIRLDLMPDLILALIQLNRLSEAVSLLQELEFLSLMDSDNSTKVWYYAISLDFQLDTGYTVLSFDTCQRFVKEEEENLQVLRDPHCKNRLYTALWLWCLRNSEWELAKPYAKVLKSMDSVNGRETPGIVFMRLKRLEGYLITLVHRMDTRSIYSITPTYVEIHALMSKLNRDIKIVKLLKPRYLLMKAYYRQIRYREDNFNRILNQAHYLAEKMKDKNTADWINHLQMAWSDTITPIQRDFWTEHCRTNVIDWHESDSSSKKQTVMYSLPLPKF